MRVALHIPALRLRRARRRIHAARRWFGRWKLTSLMEAGW